MKQLILSIIICLPALLMGQFQLDSIVEAYEDYADIYRFSYLENQLDQVILSSLENNVYTDYLRFQVFNNDEIQRIDSIEIDDLSSESGKYIFLYNEFGYTNTYVTFNDGFEDIISYNKTYGYDAEGKLNYVRAPIDDFEEDQYVIQNIIYNGDLIDSIQYQYEFDGVIIGIHTGEKFLYDENNLLIQKVGTEVFSPESILPSFTKTYTRNAQGQLLKYQEQYGNEIIKIDSFDYDNAGNIIYKQLDFLEDNDVVYGQIYENEYSLELDMKDINSPYTFFKHLNDAFVLSELPIQEYDFGVFLYRDFMLDNRVDVIFL